MDVYRSASMERLAQQLISDWAAPEADPMAFDWVLVPGTGVGRWLSLRFAQAWGVCAGIRFLTIPAYARELFGPDPWQGQDLAWAVRECASEPGCEQLKSHLEAVDRPQAAAAKVASLFRKYISYRPGWAADFPGNGWQKALMSALVARLGEPGYPEVKPQGRIAVFTPSSLSPRQLALLEGIGQASFYLLDAEPADPLGVRFNRCRAAVSQSVEQLAGAKSDVDAAHSGSGRAGKNRKGLEDPTSGSLLAAFQASLLNGEKPKTKWDSSLSFHLSHGQARQVEVLRDVLVQAFDEDPGLEPRDAVVLTPDPASYAAYIEASFSSEHPASRLRVRASRASLPESFELAEILLAVLRLPETRLTVSEMFALLRHEALANAFGIDDLDGLRELVEKAEIRWGLTPAHVARFGVGVTQNTWMAGLQRLLLGAALPAPAHLKTTAAAQGVESSDLAALGGLSELVGRLSRLLTDVERDRSYAEWVAFAEEVFEQLLTPDADGRAQVSAILQAIGGSEQVLLSRTGFLEVLESKLRAVRRRPNFCSGDLLVASPRDLAGVPHKLVVLLGFDSVNFPGKDEYGVEDLLAAAPEPGDPSRADSDRQALFDAVLSAQKLAVITQGRSDNTNLEVPLSVPIAQLLQRAKEICPDPQLVVQHALHATSPANFAPGQVSYDQRGYRGALALRASVGTGVTHQPTRTRVQAHTEAANTSSPHPLTIDTAELVSFFASPAHHLLNRRAGLSERLDMSAWAHKPSSQELTDAKKKARQDRLHDSLAPQIPLDLNGLETWKLGDKALRMRKEGVAGSEIISYLRLSGSLPPGELNETILLTVDQWVNRLEERVESALGLSLPDLKGQTRFHSVNLSFDGVQLLDEVPSISERHVVVSYSKLKAKSYLESWIPLLALRASGARVHEAWYFAKSERPRFVRLAAPTSADAAKCLEALIALYRYGLENPLPLPAEQAKLAAEPEILSLPPSARADQLLRDTGGFVKSWRGRIEKDWDVLFTSLDEIVRSPGRFGFVQAAEALWAPINQAVAAAEVL
ncbi:MAG: exodeoxyribonuclease V subunit gamma [Propionibacteriaceae bacterium]|jgi:exodeoxyribonuclease V gamma subunit|nr:exodeoxyribonuclease V subunit gamma [Propionibacteriaceae bacterium]